MFILVDILGYFYFIIYLKKQGYIMKGGKVPQTRYIFFKMIFLFICKVYKARTKNLEHKV